MHNHEVGVINNRTNGKIKVYRGGEPHCDIPASDTGSRLDFNIHELGLETTVDEPVRITMSLGHHDDDGNRDKTHIDINVEHPD